MYTAKIQLFFGEKICSLPRFRVASLYAPSLDYYLTRAQATDVSLTTNVANGEIQDWEIQNFEVVLCFFGFCFLLALTRANLKKTISGFDFFL